MRDPVTGSSRGFGFVTYLDAGVARKLINETTHTKINGRKVDLRNAEPKISDKMAILNKSSAGGAGGNEKGLGGGMPKQVQGQEVGQLGGHHGNWQAKSRQEAGKGRTGGAAERHGQGK